MSANQNDKQDRSERRPEQPGNAAPFALDGTEYEIDLSNHAVRSPESTKNAVRSPERAKKNTFFENDYLNGE